MVRSRIMSCVGLLAVTLLQTAFSQTGAMNYETPAAVVAAAVAAKERNDVEAIVDCYAPTGQEALVNVIMSMVVSTPTTLPASAEPNPDRAAFEAKYGLDKRQQHEGESTKDFAARLTSEISDKRAFLVDCMKRQQDFMKRQQASESKRPATTKPAPHLDDVKIDPSGATATGKLSSGDAKSGVTSVDMKFEKVDGSWKIASIMMY